MLVRLLKRFDLPEAAAIRELMNDHLTTENLQREADYFEGSHRGSFERTYGWAWLLKLAEELYGAAGDSLPGSNDSGHGSRPGWAGVGERPWHTRRAWRSGRAT